MSTNPEDLDQTPDDLAQLRAKAGSVDEATAKSTRLERENAFLRANVDESSPVGQMFAKAYDGELDIEAIRTAAEAVGALKVTGTPDTKPPETTVPDDEAEARRKAQLGLTVGGVPGAVPPPPADPDPLEAAFEVWNENVSGRGMSRETAAMGVIDELFKAASGPTPDARVIYDPQRDRGLTSRKIRTPGTGL